MFIIHCSSKYYCTLFNRRIYSILYFNFNFQDLFQLFPLFSPNCFHMSVRDNIGEYFRRPILNTYQTSPCIFLLKLIILRLPASAGGWYKQGSRQTVASIHCHLHCWLSDCSQISIRDRPVSPLRSSVRVWHSFFLSVFPSHVFSDSPWKLSVSPIVDIWDKILSPDGTAFRGKLASFPDWTVCLPKAGSRVSIGGYLSF